MLCWSGPLCLVDRGGHGDVDLAPSEASPKGAAGSRVELVANLASDSEVVLADDLDVELAKLSAVLDDAHELLPGLAVVQLLGEVDLDVDLGRVEAGLGLVDGAAADGAVAGVVGVLAEVDDSHEGAVLVGVGLDQLVGERVIAVLNAKVLEAGVVVDLGGSMVGLEPLSGKVAISVRAGERRQDGLLECFLFCGLGRAQPAHLMSVQTVQSAVSLDGGDKLLGDLLQSAAAAGLVGSGGGSGLGGSALHHRRGDCGVVGVVSGGSVVGSSPLLGVRDWLGHASGLQLGVGDPATVDHLAIQLNYIVGEGAGTDVVRTGAHGG